jgi:methyl coenzyme M reductase subunit C
MSPRHQTTSEKNIERIGACATDTPYKRAHTTKPICEITSKWQAEHCKAGK